MSTGRSQSAAAFCADSPTEEAFKRREGLYRQHKEQEKSVSETTASELVSLNSVLFAF